MNTVDTTANGPTRRRMLAMATGGVAAAAIAGTAGAARAAGAAPAIDTSYGRPTLMTVGTVGVTPTDTARLSIVMYADPDAGWMLCNGFLSFLNLSGVTVATRKFTLSAGQGALLDWTPRGKFARTQIYPMITVTSDMTQPGYSSVVMGATLEVFDRLTLVMRSSNVGILTYSESSTGQ